MYVTLSVMRLNGRKECEMKTAFTFFKVITIGAVIAFGLAGCANEPDPWPPASFNSSQPAAELTNGIYTESNTSTFSSMELSMRGTRNSGRFEMRDYSDKTTSDGSYRISGSQLALRFDNGFMEGKVWTFRIDNEKQFSGSGLNWTLTQGACTKLPDTQRKDAPAAPGGWNLGAGQSDSLYGTWNSSMDNGFMVINGSSVSIQANGKISMGTLSVSGDTLNIYITSGQFAGQQFAYRIVNSKLLQGDGENFSRY